MHPLGLSAREDVEKKNLQRESIASLLKNSSDQTVLAGVSITQCDGSPR